MAKQIEQDLAPSFRSIVFNIN